MFSSMPDLVISENFKLKIFFKNRRQVVIEGNGLMDILSQNVSKPCIFRKIISNGKLTVLLLRDDGFK